MLVRKGTEGTRPEDQFLLGCMKACHMHEHWTDCILAIFEALIRALTEAEVSSERNMS